MELKQINTLHRSEVEMQRTGPIDRS